MAKLENKAKENPKLEQNVLADGRISLYLEYYLGREETPVLDDNGNPVLYETGKMVGKPKVHIKHNRRKENLQLYLIAKPVLLRKGNRTRKLLNWLPKFVQNGNNSLRRVCLVIA